MMTREEAIKEVNEQLEAQSERWVVKPKEWRGLIHDIYNDFESRTCENCKYDTPYIECNKDRIHRPSRFISLSSGYQIDETFGCNKFERK